MFSRIRWTSLVGVAGGVAIGLAGLWGCEGSSPPTPATSPLTARGPIWDRTEIPRHQCAYISADYIRALKSAGGRLVVEPEPDRFDEDGWAAGVCPLRTTTYTVREYGADGALSGESRDTITVVDPGADNWVDTPPEWPSATGGDNPVLSHPTIGQGACVWIRSMALAEGFSYVVTPAPEKVDDEDPSFLVCPEGTTEYTVSAIDADGVVVARIVILIEVVRSTAPTGWLTASAEEIDAGDCVTFEWETQRASRLRIRPWTGPFPDGFVGSATVCLHRTATFELLAFSKSIIPTPWSFHSGQLTALDDVTVVVRPHATPEPSCRSVVMRGDSREVAASTSTRAPFYEAKLSVSVDEAENAILELERDYVEPLRDWVALERGGRWEHEIRIGFGWEAKPPLIVHACPPDPSAPSLVCPGSGCRVEFGLGAALGTANEPPGEE